MERKQPDVPTAAGPLWYRQIKRGLSLAAQAIMVAPVALPKKLVQAATYVSLLLGVLESIESIESEDREGDADA